MAIKNLFKRSSVAAKVPLVGDLDYGELAINYTDGVIYYKNASNAIKRFIDSDLLDARGYVTASEADSDYATDAEGALAGVTGSTGIITGGVITVNADPDKIDISAGSGYVIDDTVSPAGITLVTWTAFTAVTLTDLATATSTDIAINAAGAVVQQRSFSVDELRTHILLGGVDHVGGAIRNLFSIQIPSFAPGLSVRDLSRAIGDLNLSGNAFAAASTDLTISKSSGTVFSYGRNTPTSKTDPHRISTAALNPASFSYIFQNGSGGTTVAAAGTSINPLNYDDGTGTLNTVGVNDFAIQQFLYFANANKVFVQYGTATYNTMKEAIEGLAISSFPELTGFTSAMRRGVLIVKRGTTNLATAADAKFFVADKFGSVAGSTGVAAGQFGDMLASVYDPTAIAGDAFAMDNMVEGATTKILTDTERSKLAAIEALADVTDTTNVTAAGALMDSEVTNLAQVKAFSSADYATAAQGTLASTAVQPAAIANSGNWDAAVGWGDHALVGYLTTQTSHADVLVDSDTDNSIVTDGSNADKIVVRDASGHTGVRYAYTFYTSMNHSVASRDSDDTFYSSTDNFIRKNDAAGFRNSLGLGTAALVDILDEDTMTSDSPTAVPSQQSVKAYVDANAGGSVAIQPAAPTFSSGALWFNNDLGQLFIGYTDSDGTDNFIEAAPSGSNPVKSTGLASSTELIIYNSAGTPVKTLYGAGE